MNTDDAKDPQLSRRRFLQSGLAVGAAAAIPSLLSACGSSGSSSKAATGTTKSGGSSSSGKELVIGHLTATTGVFATVGAQMINGFETYLALNGGKLGGRPARTLTANTQGEATLALQGAQLLVTQDKVDFVDGLVSSASAAAVRNFFTQAQVPLVISNANNTTLSTTAVSPYVYRTSCTFAQYGTAAGKWFAANVAKDNVWVLAWDFVGGHEIGDAFVSSFKSAGGSIGGQIFTPFPNTADFEPFLTKIKNAGAKGVYAFYGGSNAISFVQQYRQFGLFDSVPLLGLASLADSSVVGAEGANGLGWQLETFYYPLLQNSTNQKFVAAYRKAYSSDPSYYGCAGYDAAQLIDLALHKTGGSTSNKADLVKALENPGTFQSPRGYMEMNPATHNPKQNFYVVKNVQGSSGIEEQKVADMGVFDQAS